MSYDTKRSTITVDDVTYDVEESSLSLGTQYTIQFEGEDMFEGLEGRVQNVEYDQEIFNPRHDSNVGTISVSYRGYKLGDEDISEVDFDHDCDRCEDGQRTYTIKGETVEVTCAKCNGNGWYTENPVAYFKRECGARVVLPLIVYEHSGITMRVGHVGDIMGDAQGWDTSFVGFIFDTPEQVEECIGDMSNRSEEDQLKFIEEALRAEVSEYASYLEGDVMEFVVQDDETGFHEACGGFIGQHAEVEDECYSYLEQAVIERIKEEQERLYWLEREVVTI